MVARHGHSLPELIVAVTLLGAAAGAVAASALLAARLTARAGARQEALALAAPVLDSLLGGGPAPGSRPAGAFELRWETAGEPPEVVLTARLAAGDTLVVLRSAWIPLPPRLPEP